MSQGIVIALWCLLQIGGYVMLGVACANDPECGALYWKLVYWAPAQWLLAATLRGWWIERDQRRQIAALRQELQDARRYPIMGVYP